MHATFLGPGRQRAESSDGGGVVGGVSLCVIKNRYPGGARGGVRPLSRYFRGRYVTLSFLVSASFPAAPI